MSYPKPEHLRRNANKIARFERLERLEEKRGGDLSATHQGHPEPNPEPSSAALAQAKRFRKTIAAREQWNQMNPAERKAAIRATRERMLRDYAGRRKASLMQALAIAAAG